MATALTATEFANLRTIVCAIKRNTFGVVLETETIPTMRKTDNPYFGRVTKRTHYANCAIGRDYAVACTNRNPQAQDEYKAEKPKGKTWLQFPYFLQADNGSGQLYLRVTMNKNTAIKSTYFVDGREATETEAEEIKTFLPTAKLCQKQTDFGIADEDQVRVMDFKVEGVKELHQGNLWYKRK